MKKIIFLLSIIPLTCNATTMCSQNDVVSVVLIPSAQMKNYSSDSKSGRIKWKTDDMNYEGLWACLSNDGTTNDEINAIGGEQEGAYCWGKLTHPMVSKWIKIGTFQDISTCKDRCSSSGHYGSIGYNIIYGQQMRSFLNAIEE